MIKGIQIKPKKVVIFIIVLVVLAVAIPSSVYAYNSYNYNSQYELANKYLEEDKFDEAVSSFNNSLKYNKSKANEIDDKIALVNELKQSKQSFEEAVKNSEDKKYLEAIDIFKKVSDKDINRYQLAQDNINKCKSLYIDENIASAKTQAGDKNFDAAISFLDTVLNFEPDYQEALTLKEQYNKEIQRIKEETARKEAEEKAAADKAASAAKKATQNNTTAAAPKNEIIVTVTPFPYEKYHFDLTNPGN